MTVNPWINNFSHQNQRGLMANLVQESIRFYGIDVQYLIRSDRNYDDVLKETTNVEFNRAFPIEMYIKSIDGYGGQGVFLSNIGIQIRNQVVFSVSMKSWEENLPNVTTPENITRPKEGCVIYFPLDHKLFEIKKVDRYSMFYQGGSLYTWDLTCEVFEYSGEKLATGIPAIDNIAETISVNTNEKGSIVNNEPVFDNDFSFLDKFASNKKIEDQTHGWIDFSDDNRFSGSF